MELQKKEVEQVARLACLSLTNEEIGIFQKQLSEILTYIGKLNELDTSDIKPTSHVMEIHNVFREDTARPGLTRDEALSTAPDRANGFFKVPKIIEERE
jgi:aspartyl-tRNA(Asn)/glutamyl-tRNA(Gln) amidotransferase subunit C